MQLFMPFHQADVVTVEQPVDLLTGQCHHLFVWSWPAEFFLRQALVVEHETIVFPVQALAFVAPTVGESV